MNLLFLKSVLLSQALPEKPWGFPLLKPPTSGTLDPTTFELLDIIYFIGNIINVALTIAGAITVIYIIIGGYKYIASAGNPEAMQQAKQTLFWAILGFIIAGASVIIISFLWSRFAGSGLPYPS